jgi:hypothetical protein
MSDASVALALRSDTPLVVIEAPAGCGKTFQGAEYAHDVSDTLNGGRVLILAHTHAACDVFATRTRTARSRVEIRTIDSLIVEIAAAYHLSLGLPADTGKWARIQKDGYGLLASKVAGLLRTVPMISRVLACRYPIVICDEHQDASSEQHEIAMALLTAGASLRMFGDPMQRIYGSKKKADIAADKQRWEQLVGDATVSETLDYPHRWLDGAEPLGRWILDARERLRAGGSVDLRGELPWGVSVIRADNRSPKTYGGYQLDEDDANKIYCVARCPESLLVLCSQNATVEALHAFFGRRIPIWEGHVRESLSKLMETVENKKGDALGVAQAFVTFIQDVATGFSPSCYGDVFLDEVNAGCRARRSGKPAALQSLGRIILAEPDHKGIAKALHRLKHLTSTDVAFKAIRINHSREFWDAVRLGGFDDPDDGLAEISRRRAFLSPTPPDRAISTIHKAKGLECKRVLIMPCDARHFANSMAARYCLYVAMSRAQCSLTFVVSTANPSPLILG